MLQVVSVTKGWLYDLVTLQVLSLSYNEIDFIDDDGWEFCKEVYNLNLQGNQIEIVERNILRRLPSLKFLNLKDNLISHIDATDSFAEVPDLEALYLDGHKRQLRQLHMRGLSQALLPGGANVTNRSAGKDEKYF